MRVADRRGRWKRSILLLEALRDILQLNCEAARAAAGADSEEALITA